MAQVATALTVYGIETQYVKCTCVIFFVATALTVYGIETNIYTIQFLSIFFQLQQHLPFTVLKPFTERRDIHASQVATALTVYGIETHFVVPYGCGYGKLQQHLPFTVLKPLPLLVGFAIVVQVATALTVYGIETNES